MSHEHQNRVVQFSPQLTFGNIITVVSMLGTIVTMWSAFDKRLAIVEGNAERNSKAIQTVIEIQQVQTRQGDRLQVLVEEMYKKR